MDPDRRHPLATLCLTLALIAGPLGPAARAQVTGPPRVIDGDTIEVAGRVIRLYGIDAPELGQVCRIGERAYDCGKIARTALLDLTAGVTVSCKLASPNPEGSPEDGLDGRIGRCGADGYDLSEGVISEFYAYYFNGLGFWGSGRGSGIRWINPPTMAQTRHNVS